MKTGWYKMILAVVLGAGIAYLASRADTAPAPKNYPELADIAGRDLAFKELSEYFSSLANEKGAVYAYEVLKVADLPPNVDLHLLGHVVGDILYKQRGANGITVCTQDFRNACSHTIVIGLFYEKGIEALPMIADACRKAPGGKGAYTMCFHGLGHGILAFTGYEMPQAIEFCKKTGTAAYHNREYAECVGGAVMEIIGGGFHDREIWQAANEKFLRLEDPLLPCSASYMPHDAKAQCYIYLTPQLFKRAGADLGHPTPDDFARAFPLCNYIPENEPGNRRACFGGFGKEFVVLAQNRDIRKIDEMSDEQLRTVYSWCALASEPTAVSHCMNTAASSIYWGGENDPRTVVRFCSIVPHPEQQTSCFTNLFGAVAFYAPSDEYREQFCGIVPGAFAAECRSRVLLR